jgi:hypothetical protein
MKKKFKLITDFRFGEHAILFVKTKTIVAKIPSYLSKETANELLVMMNKSREPFNLTWK